MKTATFRTNIGTRLIACKESIEGFVPSRDALRELCIEAGAKIESFCDHIQNNDSAHPTTYRVKLTLNNRQAEAIAINNDALAAYWEAFEEAANLVLNIEFFETRECREERIQKEVREANKNSQLSEKSEKLDAKATIEKMIAETPGTVVKNETINEEPAAKEAINQEKIRDNVSEEKTNNTESADSKAKIEELGKTRITIGKAFSIAKPTLKVLFESAKNQNALGALGKFAREITDENNADFKQAEIIREFLKLQGANSDYTTIG